MAKKSKSKLLPAKIGRPRREFKPEWCQQLIEHMKQGLSVESFGGVIHASSETIYKWLNEREDFAEAKKIGEAHSRLFWEKLGNAIAADDVSYQLEILKVKPFVKKKKTITLPSGAVEVETEFHIPRGNATSWIFNMKNRFGWKDAWELTGKDGEPIGKVEVTIVNPVSGGNGNGKDHGKNPPA